MQGIPPVLDSDAEDVAWALQTADALWKRSELVDAIVWLRRAAQAAGDANDDDRALSLARGAAELTEWLSHHKGAELPPPSTATPSSKGAGVDDLLRVSFVDEEEVDEPATLVRESSADEEPKTLARESPAPRPQTPPPPEPEPEPHAADEPKTLVREGSSASLPPPVAPVVIANDDAPLPQFPLDEQSPEVLSAEMTRKILESVKPAAPKAAEVAPPAPATPVPPSEEPPIVPPPPAQVPDVAPSGADVHAGMLNPWEDDPRSVSIEASVTLPGNSRVPATPAGFDEDEVITSAKPLRESLRAQAASSARPSANPDAKPEAKVEVAPASSIPISRIEVISDPPPPVAPAAAAPPKPPPLPPRPPPPKAPPAPQAAPPRPQAAPLPEPRPPMHTPPPSTPRMKNAPPLPPQAQSSSRMRAAPLPVPQSAPRVPAATPPQSAPRIAAAAPVPEPPPSVPGKPQSLRPRSVRTSTPGFVLRSDGTLDLSAIEALSDLPDDERDAFAKQASFTQLTRDQEISGFALALIIDGEVDVAATVIDAPAIRVGANAVLRSRGSTDEGVPIRLVCATDGARVATWDDEAVNTAFSSCPWVEDDLRFAADRVQALVGITVGPLGERLDPSLRDQVTRRLEVRSLSAGELVVDRGQSVPGMLIVGVGEIEVLRDDDSVDRAIMCGEFLFPDAILHAGPAPAKARAGRGGALVLYGSRALAQELLVTCPPLLEVFAGM